MTILLNVVPIAISSLLLLPMAPSALDLSSVRLRGSSLNKTAGGGCPAAYTVFPNAPTIEYKDTLTLSTPETACSALLVRPKPRCPLFKPAGYSGLRAGRGLSRGGALRHGCWLK
jgi:hypothetical protein